MDHAHRTTLGLIAVVCCLATCLSGCLQPPLGQRLVNRGRWRVHRGEADVPMEARIDPITAPGSDAEEPFTSGEEIVLGEHNFQSGRGPLCKLRWVGQWLFRPYRRTAQPDIEVAPWPERPTHEAVAADTCDEGLVYPEDGCESCGGPLAGLRCRMCGARGRVQGLFQQDTTVEYYNHPRFHPVPTRPVFQASFDSTAVGQAQTGPAASPIPASPALRGPPPLLEIIPPPMPPTPEKIHTPDPEPSRNDRLTHWPQRPVKRRPPSSWIFQPSTSPERQAARQARAYPTAKGWTQAL